MLEMTTSGYQLRRDEVVQRQTIERSEHTPRTLDGLVNNFGQRIDGVRIVTSGPRVLDIVSRLELFEAFSASVVNVLSIGDELGRRSIGSRHFDWRTG